MAHRLAGVKHPDTYSAADIDAEMNPPKWDRYTDGAEPGHQAINPPTTTPETRSTRNW